MTYLKPKLFSIGSYRDSRGFLGVIQGLDLPFSIERVFWLDEVPPGTVRGGHAHVESQQVLICTHSIIKASLEDLKGETFDFELVNDQSALYIPPKVWGSFLFENDARAIALASDPFSEEDYIRDYQSFKALAIG